MAFQLTSVIYRGYEIVSMPGGLCLIHFRDRSGSLVGQQPSQVQAMAFVDRLCRQARGEQS